MGLKVVLVKAHQSLRNNEDVREEVSSVQSYLDQSISPIVEERVVYIPLKASYKHVTRKMVLQGVFATSIKKGIAGLSGNLEVYVENQNEKSAVSVVEFAFPPEFIGRLNENECFIVHLEIPMEGLTKDSEFSTHEIKCNLSNCHVLVCQNKKV